MTTNVDYQSLGETAEEHARSVQHPKGKLTARERISELTDSETFVEFGRFRGGDPADGFLGAGVVTGFAQIFGRDVALYVQDFSIKGGTLGNAEGTKICALIDRALELRTPIIALLDSGGARIQEGVESLAQYGHVFRKCCEASGLVPQISVILGPCAGGAVYSPALTDFVIMTEQVSHMFVTGPEVVRAVTGESVSLDELGGGRLHSERSGVAHYLADSEEDALDYVRALLSYLPDHCGGSLPEYRYDGEDELTDRSSYLASIVPRDSRKPYDAVEVIENISDYGEFLEVSEGFARSIVVGFSCLSGRPVGVVANQPMHNAGTLDVDASEKAARFVRCCDAYGLPIVTLVDVPGYLPGASQESSGIIRRGAKLLMAYAEAAVPLVTVIVRKAYGGAFVVMGSKSIGADVCYAWPGAEVAVMGAEGAVNILHRKELKDASEAVGDAELLRARRISEYEKAVINTNRSIEIGEIDEIIDPCSTRDKLIKSLLLHRDKVRVQECDKWRSNGPL